MSSLRSIVVLATAVVAAVACRKADITDGRYQGMIELEQLDLAFELGGRVAALAVHPGQDVAAGAPIATQDDVLDREQREIRARGLDVAKAELALIQAGTRAEDVKAARAQLTAARTTEQALTKDVARERALVNRGAIAGAHLDDLEAQLARARGERSALEQRVRALASGARDEEVARAAARVALAEQSLALEDKKLDKRVLVAPVAGTVLDTYVDPGEIATPGGPVASIVDRRHPYADVFVPVEDAPAIRIGAPVALALEGVTGEYPGTVERVFPHAEFTPRYVYSPRERPNLMIRVRVRLTDETGALHAGLPAFVRIVSPAVAGGPS
jgi:HlyD family secretion protein